MDRDIPRGRIGHHLRNNERANPGRSGRPLLDVLGVLLLVFGQAADPATDNGAAPVRVFVAEVDATVLDGRYRRGKGELREAVKAARCAHIEDLLRFEMVDLAAEMNFEVRGVEQVKLG